MEKTSKKNGFYVVDYIGFELLYELRIVQLV